LHETCSGSYKACMKRVQEVIKLVWNVLRKL